MRTLIILLLTALLATTATAQTTFEGTLHFSTSYSGEGTEKYIGLMPTGREVTVKEDMRKVLYDDGYMANRIMVYVTDGKEYRLNVETKTYEETEWATFLSEKYESTDLNQTDTIMGMACKKYKVVTQTDGLPTTFYFWITTELNMTSIPSDDVYKFGFKGVAIRWIVEVERDGALLVIDEELDRIDPHPVDDAVFEWPADYTLVEKK